MLRPSIYLPLLLSFSQLSASIVRRPPISESLTREFQNAEDVVVGTATCDAASLPCPPRVNILQVFKGQLQPGATIDVNEPVGAGLSQTIELVRSKTYLLFMCDRGKRTLCGTQNSLYRFPRPVDNLTGGGLDQIYSQLVATVTSPSDADYDPALQLLIGLKRPVDRSKILPLKSGAAPDRELLIDTLLVGQNDISDTLDDLYALATEKNESHTPNTTLFLNALEKGPPGPLIPLLPTLVLSKRLDVRSLALETIEKDSTGSHMDLLITLTDDPQTQIAYRAITAIMLLKGIKTEGMPSYAQFNVNSEAREKLRALIKQN